MLQEPRTNYLEKSRGKSHWWYWKEQKTKSSIILLLHKVVQYHRLVNADACYLRTPKLGESLHPSNQRRSLHSSSVSSANLFICQHCWQKEVCLCSEWSARGQQTAELRPLLSSAALSAIITRSSVLHTCLNAVHSDPVDAIPLWCLSCSKKTFSLSFAARAQWPVDVISASHEAFRLLSSAAVSGTPTSWTNHTDRTSKPSRGPDSFVGTATCTGSGTCSQSEDLWSTSHPGAG